MQSPNGAASYAERVLGQRKGVDGVGFRSLRILGIAGGVAALGVTVLAAPPAVAGGPSAWSPVDTGVTNTARPGLFRLASGLEVVWTKGGVGSTGLYRRDISATGAAGGITPVISGWDTLVSDPVPLAGSVALAGLRGSVGDPDFWSGRGFLVSDAGALTGTLSAADTAYAGDQDATQVAGTSVYVFSQGSDVSLHSGTVIGTDFQVTTGGCCRYYPAIATAPDGTGWVGWYSNDTVSSIAVRPVTGLPGAPVFGDERMAPGYDGESVDSPSQRLAMATRPDGSAWLAYPVAKAGGNVIRVWRMGTGTVRTITVPQSAGDRLRHVALASDSSGRLWVSFLDSRTGRVSVTRSDAAATTFGAVVQVAPPPGDGVFSTAISATPTRSDVVINTGSALHHRQFLPGLAIASKVTSKKGSLRLKVRITDAGAAVVGALVRVKGYGKAVTKPTGTAKFTIGAKHPKKVKVTASRSGYSSNRAVVKLKH